MRLSINEIKKKYPIFFKIEEMKYDDKLDIQVHCKNHKCKNSKEKVVGLLQIKVYFLIEFIQ